MTRWFLCAAPLFCVMLPNMLSAQSYSVGDRVVVIRESPISLPEGQVDDAFIGQVLQVGALNGKWLWVAGGRPGWLDSSSVVPLDRRAIDRLTELIRAEPRNANLYYGRAIVWRELGEMEIAMGDYNEAIRLRPEKAAFFNSRGVAWQNKGEYDKAIADYNEAVRLNPKNEAAYVNRGSAWADKGEYDKAIDDFSEALRRVLKGRLAWRESG